jgi:hypothetical protein
MLMELLISGSWLSFAAYCGWYFFKAKTFQALTLDDLALTWRMHKRETGCRASRINSLITMKNEVIGFKCEGGYEFKQKRLITQKVRNPHEFSGKFETSCSFKNFGGRWEEKS